MNIPLGAHRGQEHQERCFRSGGYAREQASRHFKVVGKLWCLNRRVLASSLRPTRLEFKFVMCNHEVEPLQGKCLPRRMRRRPRTLLAGHAWVVQLVRARRKVRLSVLSGQVRRGRVRLWWHRQCQSSRWRSIQVSTAFATYVA